MDRFINGKLNEFPDWLDTDGNVINASDGGVIFAEGRYHWYGQAMRDLPFAGNGAGGQVTDVGVVMYASDDLYNWEYEGVILACSDEGELRSPMRFERPKIIYNEKTKQYVLWCHYVEYPGDHGFDIGKGEAGLAVCDSVNGSYRWLGHTRPIDADGVVRDLTLYKEDDGTAYMIFDRDISLIEKSNRCQYIIRLTDDYLSFTGEYARIDPCYRREASALLHRGDYYYMITSDMTSWDFNAAKYYRARELFGPWEDMGDPCVDDDGTTFASQTTYVFRVEGSDTLIHMAERHNTKNFLHCSYVWLPILFDDESGRLRLEYSEQWKLK